MAIGKRVTVIDYPDGRLVIRYRGVELAYRTFDKIRQVSQAAIVENKQLGAALAFIREQQLSVAVDHAGATSATPACSRSAELSYEPSERALARQINRLPTPLNRTTVGRCATLGLRARPPSDPSHRGVTFLNGRNSDISKWWTQDHR